MHDFPESYEMNCVNSKCRRVNVVDVTRKLMRRWLMTLRCCQACYKNVWVANKNEMGKLQTIEKLYICIKCRYSDRMMKKYAYKRSLDIKLGEQKKKDGK